MFAVMLLTLIPHEAIATDRCDVIEINSVHDKETGKFIFRQAIWWNWERERFHVADWRYMADDDIRPIGSVSTWHDGTVLRCVECLGAIETYTTWDEEIRQRSVRRQEERGRLFSGRTKGGRMNMEGEEIGRAVGALIVFSFFMAAGYSPQEALPVTFFGYVFSPLTAKLFIAASKRLAAWEQQQ